MNFNKTLKSLLVLRILAQNLIRFFKQNRVVFILTDSFDNNFEFFELLSFPVRFEHFFHKPFVMETLKEIKLLKHNQMLLFYPIFGNLTQF